MYQKDRMLSGQEILKAARQLFYFQPVTSRKPFRFYFLYSILTSVACVPCMVEEILKNA